jgi:hypothetical protein
MKSNIIAAVLGNQLPSKSAEKLINLIGIVHIHKRRRQLIFGHTIKTAGPFILCFN